MLKIEEVTWFAKLYNLDNNIINQKIPCQLFYLDIIIMLVYSEILCQYSLV